MPQGSFGFQAGAMDHSVIGAMTESSNAIPPAEAVVTAPHLPIVQKDTDVHADNSKSSKGRVIRRSSKTGYDAWAEDEIKGDQASKPKSSHSRGRWDGAISPRTPGFMPPMDGLPPIELPKLPGGGGVFKCAAVAVLREEKRLMSTGEIARMALRKGYIRCQGKTPEATMASALYTDVKKKNDNSVFTRPEEGLFGLREWEGPTTVTDPSGPPQQKTSSKRVRDKAPSQAEAKPPKPVPAKPASSSLSGEENLLLLLNAADELEAEDAPAIFIPKKRRSDTGDSSHAKRVSAAARATQAVQGRSVPITRPRPLELPINSMGHASMVSKLPISAPITPSTALDQTTKSPTISPDATSPSHDSNTMAAHQIFNAAVPRTAAPSSRAEGDEAASVSHDAACACETSSSDEGEAAGDYHMAHQMPGNSKFPEPISLPMNGSFPQVGQMLAAEQFAARLVHANALVSQLEQAFGKRHPLVGKAYMAKARICQLEGSRLALLEAEQAILQAQSILHDTSEAQEEIHYLLNSIRTQAYMMSTGQHNILLNAVCPNMQ